MDFLWFSRVLLKELKSVFFSGGLRCCSRFGDLRLPLALEKNVIGVMDDQFFFVPIISVQSIFHVTTPLGVVSFRFC